MSLYGALFSGVSGLQSQSSAMGAISDNISNVNTTGYKGTSVNFQTLVTSQVALTEYSPGGVQSKPRAGIDVQGLLQATNSSTDVGLSGQGFFVVNTAAQPSIEGGTFGYTRAGSFKPDKNGFLQNAAGFYMQGWPLVPSDNTVAAVPGQETINGTAYMKAYKQSDGTYHYINQNIVNTSELQPFNVNTIGGTAQATANLSMGANLPSGDAIYNPNNPSAGGIHTTNVLCYDSLGNTGNSQFTWTKTAANTWSLGAQPPAGAAVANLVNYTAANGTQYYASQGQLEFQSVPAGGSYFQLSGTVGSNTTPSYIRVQFYNSSTSPDPTADGPTNPAGTATNPYILGVDLNGLSAPADVAKAVQNALRSAANQPSQKGTFNIASILQGGKADGANRFTQQGNTLQIIQEPGANAINVNCSTWDPYNNKATNLGTSILESGAGVGSGADTTDTIKNTAGQFTVQAIATGYSTTSNAQTTNHFAINSVNQAGVGPSASTVAGTNKFSFPAGKVPSGGLTISKLDGSSSQNVSWATLFGGAPVAAGDTITPTMLTTAINNINGTAGYTGLGITASVSGNSIVLSSTNTSSTLVQANAGSVVPGEVVWANGTDGKVAAANAEAVPPGNFLQIGNVQISWQQLVDGKITDYYNAATGQSVNAAPLPITLPNGLNGTAATALAANQTDLLTANIAAAYTALNGNLSGTASFEGVSAAEDVTNKSQLDLTSGTTTTSSIFVNNGDVTWANGGTGNATPVVMGAVGIYSAAGGGITFNGDGTPASIVPNALQLDWANGAENQVGTTGSATIKPQINLNFGHLNQADGITQLGGGYQVNFLNQDGAKFGNFSGVSIGSDGVVTALFDNGVRSPVFQIPIATFANPDGMQSLSGNVFISTSTSGAYTLRTPGEAGSGQVSESTLEASTVDIGTEFTSMITVQNAYSAAAKIITTTNQMLNDLINIKQ